MSILNSLPKKIGMASETNSGLMSSEDKILVNKINRIEYDVTNKMNRDEKIKSSQLDISNDDVKIQVQNLSSKVIKMMTGDTPVSAQIGFKSVNTDHIADESVTFNKRTPVGSIAVIVSSEFCNFDTTGDEEYILSIPRDYSVYFGDKVRTVIDTPDYVIVPKGVPSVIVFNEMQGFIAYDITAIREQDFIVGAFDGTNVTMFNGRYTVNHSVVVGDNALHGSAINDFSLDSRKLAIQHGIILSEDTNAPYLNVNFRSRFVEVVKPFELNVADQYVLDIKANHECSIPENISDNKYLYIYYNLGTGRLSALWSSEDLTKPFIVNDEKLVLIGIIYNETEAVGVNSEYISVNSISLKNKNIEYTDIFSGKIIIDFKNKKITSNDIKAFIDDKLIALTETSTQTIELTDDIVTDITKSGIAYSLGVYRVNFTTNEYRLVFKKTEEIESLGLDAIILTSIKDYTISHNKDNIVVVKTDGNIVKANNIISSGYTLPIDNETIIVELVTEIIDGNLHLSSTILPGTSVVDPSTNVKYDIKEAIKYSTIVDDLHGLYSVLFNTETSKIEIVSIKETINNEIYISLGFVYELNDSISYTALGNIVNHITLNGNRPSNYVIADGPDPDKGYNWHKNRLVLPRDIYLLANSPYNLYCQNMSINKYIDNDYISYEIGLPHASVLTENILNINCPFTGDYETRIVGKFKGNNNCLFKDVNLHFNKPEGKELAVLCIGDDTVDLNMPGYVKDYLTQLGYTPTMLGTVKNTINVNGYGKANVSEEFGEGHKGWRFTDFMCETYHKDRSEFYIENNPFMNNSKQFDFSHYMTTNAYEKVDVVVVSVGLNDIIGYHTSSAIEDIETLNINQIIEIFPKLYKEMISSIHAYDSNIKIIINPTMIKGIDDEFNKKSLQLTETLVYDLKDITNVFFVPGYLSQPLFVSANKTSTENYDMASDINDTKLGTAVNSLEINGMAQSNLAYLITSAIIGVTK